MRSDSTKNSSRRAILLSPTIAVVFLLFLVQHIQAFQASGPHRSQSGPRQNVNTNHPMEPCTHQTTNHHAAAQAYVPLHQRLHMSSLVSRPLSYRVARHNILQRLQQRVGWAALQTRRAFVALTAQASHHEVDTMSREAPQLKKNEVVDPYTMWKLVYLWQVHESDIEAMTGPWLQ